MIVVIKWGCGPEGSRPAREVRGKAGRQRGGRAFINSFGALKALRSLDLSLIKLRQKSLSVWSPIFHDFLPVFAGRAGLAVVVHGQNDDRRKPKCPTNALKRLTR